jgi:hypothetical protein
MSEGFEVVRTIRQHLRRGAALLEEGKLDQALGEADAALSLDPRSLPAQALRDRIHRVQRTNVDARADAPARESIPSFVPQGVNAASWRGFEQRITERRFRALLEAINVSIVSGDAQTARAALDEARELKPDAIELADFGARVAAMPASAPAPEPVPASRIWARAMGAAALFLIGLSMFAGLELIRPSEDPAPAPEPAAIEEPAPPVSDVPIADAVPPQARPDPLATTGDEDFVPAIVTPPEPTRRPREAEAFEPAPRPAVLRDVRPAIDRSVGAPADRPIETRRVVEETPLRPPRETPDEYVAPSLDSRPISTPAATMASAGVPRSAVSPPRAPTPDPAPARVPAAGPTPPAAAAAVPSAAVLVPGDQSRVEDVLRRYARAYDALDASAARAVWPSVDEKALARAFQDLSSQNVSFDSCDIDVRGAVANALCSGQASYVGRVGSREPRVEPRTWRFELRRDGDAWKIQSAETRRQSVAAPDRER